MFVLSCIYKLAFIRMLACYSLHEIFSTDAGQLSDILKSFAGQISICRTEGIFVVRILFSLLRFTGHTFVRQTKSFCRPK